MRKGEKEGKRNRLEGGEESRRGEREELEGRR